MKPLIFLALLCIFASCSCSTSQKENPLTNGKSTYPRYHPEEAKQVEDALLKKATFKTFIFVKLTSNTAPPRIYTSNIIEYNTTFTEDDLARLKDKAENAVSALYGSNEVSFEREIIMSQSYSEASEKLHNIPNRLSVTLSN